MINALLIGCGNIGAFYDWETDDIRTYAKAFHAHGIKLSVYDPNYEKSAQVAGRYGAQALQQWDDVPANKYEIVVIGTPTPTHFDYLTTLLSNPPRLIICEKPVDLDPDRLEKIKTLYANCPAKVMVNFHRRFQPKMVDLAQRVQKMETEDLCQTILVRYQRGFHNNASHAMDLLGLLFGKPFDASLVTVLNSVPDEYDEDPTITVAYQWNGIQVLFVGLIGAKFSHFEMTLYFSRHAIELRQGGDAVEFFSTQGQQGKFYPALRSDEVWTNTLRDHMSKVVAHALRMLDDPTTADNFLESIDISKKIISLSQGTKR